MIYVPEYINGNCAYIYNADIIRVYDTVPRPNSTVNYRDYYIKSSYIYNEGSTTFGNYSSFPTCIGSDRITTDVYYRNDIVNILLIFLIFSYCCLWLPFKLLFRIFRRYN